MMGEGLAVLLAAAIAALFVLAVLFGVATLALRIRNERRASRWARLEAEWTPRLLAMLSGDLAPSAVALGVADRDRLMFVSFLLRFVRRLRGAEREMLSALAAPFLEDVAPLARRGNAEARARAVLHLGILGPVRHAATVVAALDDPSPVVAMTAARTLARQGHAEHVGAILNRLPRFSDWSPGFITSMLVAIGPGAAPALRELLADAHRAPADRAVAAEALRTLHDLPAADPAGEIVATASDPDLLAAALRLLGAAGSAKHAPAVRAACGSADATVRAQACAALGAIGNAQDAGRLAESLEDPSPWVVLHAVRSLRAIGGDAVLRAAAARSGADLVRQAAAEQRP